MSQSIADFSQPETEALLLDLLDMPSRCRQSWRSNSFSSGTMNSGRRRTRSGSAVWRQNEESRNNRRHQSPDRHVLPLGCETVLERTTAAKPPPGSGEVWRCS